MGIGLPARRDLGWKSVTMICKDCLTTTNREHSESRGVEWKLDHTVGWNPVEQIANSKHVLPVGYGDD